MLYANAHRISIECNKMILIEDGVMCARARSSSNKTFANVLRRKSLTICADVAELMCASKSVSVCFWTFHSHHMVVMTFESFIVSRNERKPKIKHNRFVWILIVSKAI